MITCKACGANQPGGSTFCDQCGHRLRGDDVDGYDKPFRGDDVDGYSKPFRGDDVDGYGNPSRGDDVDGYDEPSRGDDVDGYESGAVAQVTPMTGLITPDPDRPTGRETKASPALAPGETFADRYKVEKVVGRGGMGTVYKTVDTISDKPTALKLINTSYVGGEKAIHRLIEEGVTARDIRHPNVVAVYDVGLSAGQAYVAMEYLDGISLREWHGRTVQRGETIPLRVAARITVEILAGLNAAHEAGVIHRDLKPENIILLQDPTEKSAPLKLLDFGIARAAGGASSTSSHTGLGTPDYMAPEQRTNPDSAGPPADLYSLSVMLYELLVGVVPGRHWQPPSGGRSDVPQEVDALILKGMSDNRALRPQNAEQYRKELIAAVNRVPVPLPPSSPGPAGRTPSAANGSLIAWVIGGSAATLLVIIAIAAALFGTDPGPNPNPNPEPVPVPNPSNPYAYYSGEWADGYGGYYAITVSPNGSFTGAGASGDGTPVNIRGGISGNSLQYTLNVRGQDLASGRGTKVDACHFNFQTFDLYGNLNLTGQFHVNHEPGAPCP
ncbi:serine/threonine-protein kinase [Hyphomonas sp.]|uniref:serine/threonine-protein kinase n=1 Tax=Hyphomonas sp. TaxID=87 RepID=UPI0025C53EF5|nr:serine/threonine-protein kinase [Hyphomonas sp.]